MKGQPHRLRPHSTLRTGSHYYVRLRNIGSDEHGFARSLPVTCPRVEVAQLDLRVTYSIIILPSVRTLSGTDV